MIKKKFYLFEEEEIKVLLNAIQLLAVELEIKIIEKNLIIESDEAKAEIKFGSNFLN